MNFHEYQLLAKRTAIDFCLVKFFVEGDDGFHQARADSEIVKAADVSAKRAEAANKRHSKNGAIASASAKQLDTHSTTTATAEPNGSALGASQAKPPSRAKTRRGLPDYFPAESDRDWAQQLWLQKGRVDLCGAMADQAAAFRDHHTQHGKSMADWPAAWRTWARNALRFGGPAPRAAAPAKEWKPLKVVNE